MLGNILEIKDNQVLIKLSIDINSQPNLVNLHVIFEDDNKKIVGEIAKVTQTTMSVNIVGEIENNIFLPGSTSRPSFKSKIRIINLDELELIFGSQTTLDGFTNFGTSNIYANYKINININEFFSNHFAILGNSGSGKSCTVASILQKLLKNNKIPINANLFFFDAYGEYTNAFVDLHKYNDKLNFKIYTTNPDDEKNLLKIPCWLLDVDDLALLLDVDNPAQLQIIEKALSLVKILTGSSETVIKVKNDIIARALQDILLSGNDSVKIHDQVLAILTKFNTNSLNTNTKIAQPGYVRTLKQCLFIDKTGKMQDMEVVVDFIRTFIIDEDIEIPPEELNQYYTLKDLELAVEFSLISEGILKSDKVFDYANIVSVRLHNLAAGENAKYFTYDKYIDRNSYIDSLLIDQSTGGKCQVVNFNINYVDDRMAKVITKTISRMLFLKSSTTVPRGSISYHIIIEEAHRYVQNDKDINIIGYNIFERITKEGRKYGCFLGLITQRPSELSDTCISQCANFITFRTLHPKDLNYIKDMLPNITSEIVLQLKNLKPGNCIGFGSAFKVPTMFHVDMPNPKPLSNNVDLNDVWYNVQKNIQNNIADINNITDINNIIDQQVIIKNTESPISNNSVSIISTPTNTTPIVSTTTSNLNRFINAEQDSEINEVSTSTSIPSVDTFKNN